MAEENGSIFDKFRKPAGPAAQPGAGQPLPPPPPPRPAAAGPLPPPPPLPPQQPDQRVTALQEEVAALRAELAELKSRPAPEQPRPPEGGGNEFAFRLGRAEELLEALRRQLSSDEEAMREGDGKAASRDELKDMGLRVGDLGASFDGLKRAVSSEGELAARLGQTEAAVTELRTVLEGQQRKLKSELEALAPRETADEMRVNLAGAIASLDEMKLNFAQYSEELSSMGAECRKALGEAQGLAKAAAQGGGAARFDEHLKDLVAKLHTRLAQVETAMHAGLSELAARFNGSEVLYNKMFSAAEERLNESLGPKLKDIDGQLRWLRENVIRLADDYTVVAERKMKALEAKYSAFEAISRRMDAIDAALKMGGRIGLP